MISKTIDDLFAFIKENELNEENTILEKSHDLELHPVDEDDLEDEIKRVILHHYPNDINEKIYHWNYGNYFVTDKGEIYSIKRYCNASKLKKKIDAIKRFNEILEEKKKYLKPHELKRFIASQAPDAIDENDFEEKTYIYRRNSRERYFKFYIKARYKKHLETLGYKVNSEESFYKTFNQVTKEFETYKVYHVRMDKRIMIEMAKNKIDIMKGKTSSGNDIKRGRPSRKIVLIEEATSQEVRFDSIEECAQVFGASLITIKRALKGKKENDIITIKKKQYILK